MSAPNSFQIPSFRAECSRTECSEWLAGRMEHRRHLRNQDHGAGLPFRLAMEDVYFRNCSFIIFPTANGERLARAILESRPAKNVRTSQSFQKRFNALSRH